MCTPFSSTSKRYLSLSRFFGSRSFHGIRGYSLQSTVTKTAIVQSDTAPHEAQSPRLSAGPKGKQRASAESEAPPLWPGSEPAEPVSTSDTSLNKVESALNRLEAHQEAIRQNQELPPSTEDFERFRPKDISEIRRRDFEGYRKVYTETYQALLRSFTANQLYGFVKKLIKVRKAYKLNKNGLVHALLERHWGMPRPDDEEKRRRALVEIRERSFPIKLVELFLLLGQDGSEFKALASRFRVQLFINKKPMAIRALGLEHDLHSLEKHFHAFRQTFITEVFSPELKHRLSPDVIQSMSRLVGTFIEAKEHGRFQLTSINARSLESAKRLISRALTEEAITSGSPFFAHTESQYRDGNPAMYPSLYSLFPFVSPGVLPWNMGASSAFRCKRIGEWIMGHKMGAIHSLEGEGVFLSSQTDRGNPSIRQVILDSAPPDSLIRLTARTGHLLLKHDQAASRVELSSPLPGSWPLSSLLQWLRTRDTGRAFFVPSSPSLQRAAAELEAYYLQLKYCSTIKPTNRGSKSPKQVLVFTCEVPLVEAHLVSLEGKANSRNPAPDHPCRLSLGTELGLDLLLPDRPVDLRIIASVTQELSLDKCPDSLWQYVKKIVGSELSSPPDSLLIDGQRYTLYGLQTAKRLMTQVATGSEQGIRPEEWPELSDFNRRNEREASATVPVEMEDTLDLETETRSSVCLAQCPDIRDDVEWRRFLRHCDQLTLQMYPAVPAGQRAPSLSSLEA